MQKRYSGGSIPIKSVPRHVPIDVPEGNINGKWKHDLHHQLHDEGPARTRYTLTTVCKPDWSELLT